jgi:hypothetical protein
MTWTSFRHAQAIGNAPQSAGTALASHRPRRLGGMTSRPGAVDRIACAAGNAGAGLLAGWLMSAGAGTSIPQ